MNLLFNIGFVPCYSQNHILQVTGDSYRSDELARALLKFNNFDIVGLTCSLLIGVSFLSVNFMFVLLSYDLNGLP